MQSASVGHGWKHLFADDAYDRLTLMDKATYLDCIVEIIRPRDAGWSKGFAAG